MFPKEHGAYGQLVFPLLTAFAVAGAAWPSVLMAAAVVLMFLAHEPLLVLLGWRGRREQDARGARAWWALMIILSAATAAATLALDGMPNQVRWTFLVPAVPAVWSAVAMVRGREKTVSGEAAVALAFAAVALPVSAAGGEIAAGILIAIAYGLLFVLGTLAVRVVVLRTRGGGNPRAARRTRLAVLLMAAAGTVAACAGATDGVLSWMAVAAILPGIAFASVLAAFPPPASRLKRVGWSLVGVTAATAILLIAAV